MAYKKFPINPPRPERNCWGCDLYCAADKMVCGNGSDRTQHPAELFGADWAEWDGNGRPPTDTPAASGAGAPPPAAPVPPPWPALPAHRHQ